MLVNLAGGQKELTCFQPEGATEAEYSCSINWQNELFIFGGWTEKRQISRLSGHKLERLGDLDFDIQGGSCNIMADRLYFCFTRQNGKRCRKSTGPLEQFSEVALTTHYHNSIQISCSDSKFFVFIPVSHDSFSQPSCGGSLGT